MGIALLQPQTKSCINSILQNDAVQTAHPESLNIVVGFLYNPKPQTLSILQICFITIVFKTPSAGWINSPSQPCSGRDGCLPNTSAWICVLQMPTDLQTNDPKGELRQWTSTHYNLKSRQRLGLTTMPLFVQVSESSSKEYSGFTPCMWHSVECACVCVWTCLWNG